MELDITVLGGLPVTIEFGMQPAELDVGIMNSYCDEWYVVAIAGRKCKKPPQWLYNRIDAKKGEEERITLACEDYADSYNRDNYPDEYE